MVNEAEQEHWRYNCEDTVRTYEIAQVEKANLASMGLSRVNDFQQQLFYPVLHAMLRGVRIDRDARSQMAKDLKLEMRSKEDWFLKVLGHSINPRSPKQLQRLFYEDFKLRPVISRKTKKPTLDDEALTKLMVREPLVKPLISAISAYRSCGVFLSTFVNAALDTDGRMRCSYNICGTETYRFSSSTNAFGTGTNLQNIPKGDEDEAGTLPNIKKLFIPDEGYTFFDMDLKRADLYVVVWEAEDNDLKEALALDLDMHCVNAVSIYDIKGIPYDELNESHPNYKEHRSKIGYTKRHGAKEGVHATNYGCKGRTLAVTMGTTVHEADRFIGRWLQAHPGILQWHKRVERDLTTRRYVENRFGYRRFYFDRIEGLLPKALAWVPQSTVACLINRIWVSVFNTVPTVQVLLQVHDSLAGQFPKDTFSRSLSGLLEAAKVVIPYEEPLIIPVGIKTSNESWGACE